MVLTLLTILAGAALTAGIAVEIAVLVVVAAVALCALAVTHGLRTAGALHRHVLRD